MDEVLNEQQWVDYKEVNLNIAESEIYKAIYNNDADEVSRLAKLHYIEDKHLIEIFMDVLRNKKRGF